MRTVSPEKVSFRSYTHGSRIAIVLRASEDVTGNIPLHVKGEGGVTVEPTILAANDAATAAPVDFSKGTLVGVSLTKGVPCTILLELDEGPRLCLSLE